MDLQKCLPIAVKEKQERSIDLFSHQKGDAVRGVQNAIRIFLLPKNQLLYFHSGIIKFIFFVKKNFSSNGNQLKISVCSNLIG